MPLVKSTYKKAPFYLFNGHLQSIYPSVARKIEGVDYKRERLTLSDGDFVDLDWLDRGNNKLLIITHGLEGDSNRQYVKGAAKLFSQAGWDVLAWNCRSCSGEMNKKFRLYSHGEIGDFGEVIQHAQKRKEYAEISLMGHSLGGSITLKYLGVKGSNLDKNIKSATAFSTPCDLKGGAEILDKFSNYPYRKKFLTKLRLKIEHKAAQFPGRIDLSDFDKIKIWKDFDDLFSAPMNGYKDAEEFYRESSAKNFIRPIAIPTLLCSAKNDPILPESCYPIDICEKHKHLFLEIPEKGGHCGFLQAGDEFAYSERRALAFVENQSGC